MNAFSTKAWQYPHFSILNLHECSRCSTRFALVTSSPHLNGHMVLERMHKLHHDPENVYVHAYFNSNFIQMN